MCLFAMGLTNPFCDPIHAFGLPNILWQQRVPQFKHALCREWLPPLCFKPAAWYFHWLSQTVRSPWIVIPQLPSLYHSHFFVNFHHLSQAPEFPLMLNTVYLDQRQTLKSLSSIKQKSSRSFISALFTQICELFIALN